MARIHVFAIDWVPSKSEIASGGGLRSLQIIDSLREAGHEVSYSVPANSRQVRRIGRTSAALRHVELHDQFNQLDILNSLRPDVVFWLPTLVRNVPFSGTDGVANICDLIGLPHHEAAMGATGSAQSIANRLMGLCAGADFVLTGSEEQNGYWQAELERHDLKVPTAIVPYALPLSMAGAPALGSASLKTLHITGMIYAWSTSVELLGRVADWVSLRKDVRLALIAGTDPGGATDTSELTALHAITTRLGIRALSEATFEDAMAEYQPGSLSLDIYQPSPERRLAVPIRTVNALAHAVPILSTIDGAFTRRLRQAGAGVIATDQSDQPLEVALDRLASSPKHEFGKMARAALAFSNREFSAKASSEALLAAVGEALDRRAARRKSWHGRVPDEKRLGQVLVLSDEGENLRDLRVKIPFEALHSRQQISGYSIWCREKFIFSTSASPRELSFDAIWVQRHVGPEVSIALSVLDRPFVYDLDDNLLNSPSYRKPFSLESVQTVRNMVRVCTVLSCSTARLAQLVQRAATEFIADKTIVTPNLVRESMGQRKTGVARVVIWSSTDTPALTRSRVQVVKALRDFCLAYGLKLVCIGSPPPDLLIESAVEIEHIGALPYAEYLSLLRSHAPAILVCPLETNADQETLDFVNGKSDIKVLEALATGLIGVFSRAPPYLDSDLPAAILCENTYTSWFEGLTAAWQSSEQTFEPRSVPDSRIAGSLGLEPWREALGRVELSKRLPFDEFESSLTLLRGRLARRFLSHVEFDPEFYLEQYPDIRLEIAKGRLEAPYAHYRDHGFREGRLGRPADMVGSHNEQFWANLMHTVGDLRSTVEARSTQIGLLRARRATRLNLRRK